MSGSAPVPVEVPLRDVKYDIAPFSVHGASYRNMGSDPSLQLQGSGRVAIVEDVPLHTAPFSVLGRKLNAVEAYGGLEELKRVSLPPGGTFTPGRIVFPVARGAGGTDLPILVPIARIRIEHATVSLRDYRGARPSLTNVAATTNSVEAFVDWEMSHRSHKLLFDTPGFHIGVQGVWTATSSTIPHTGVQFMLGSAAYQALVQSLHLLVAFDEEFIKVALHRANPNLATNFVAEARRRYGEIDGEGTFGHRFNVANFQEALAMIGERVQAQPGLQRYYVV